MKRREPLAWFQARMPIAPDQQRDIGVAYHASLTAMFSGHGNEQAWSTLACSLNNTLILCEKGYCAGAIPAIKLAQQALINCKRRAEIHHRYGFSGDEARAIMAALNTHDEQLSRATRAHITEALREVHRRVEEGEVLA